MTLPIFARPDIIKDKLHVVTCVFNSQRYRRRWDLYVKFAKHIKDLGGELTTVEASFGERADVIVDENLPEQAHQFNIYGDELKHRVVHVRTSSELWIKENLLNIGISHLPKDWKYVAWIDADVHFVRPDIIGETIHKLQHYDFVQMFSEAQDLGPNYEPFLRHRSFMYSYKHNDPKQTFATSLYYGEKLAQGQEKTISWHPGFAWAARRSAINAVGGLIDFAPLGAADNHMAKGLIGDASQSVHPNCNIAYIRMILEWERKALEHIRKNVGYVDGLLLHYFHGPKSARKYWSRWQILVESQFDPLLDLKKSWEGVYVLEDRKTDHSIRLRDGIREYLQSRDEDSTYLPPEEHHMKF